MSIRTSSRATKGQHSIRFGAEPDVPAPQPVRPPRQARQPPAPANVAIPALVVQNGAPNIPINNNRRRDDKGDIKTSPYWNTYFYIPNDAITQKYNQVVEYYENLPASLTDGLGNLEVIDPEPIKEIPSLRRLINGDYQTASSKSDKNIAASIKFFVNNLPSFAQFKNQDNLDWVVMYHRLLTTELLEYSLNHHSSIATLKSKFNAITRILRLAFKSKTPDLYSKFSYIVFDLGIHFEDDEHNNELSPEEEKKFVSWDVILARQQQLQRQFYSIQNKHTKPAYDLNNDLLLLSLYSLIPPLRNEVKHLKFTHSNKTDYDYIWLDNDGEVLLDLNLNKKRHDPIVFSLTKDAPELAKLITDSYTLYPREYVFTAKNKYPDLTKKASENSLDGRLRSLFYFTGKNVSVNSLRSSYVSYMVHQGLLRGKLLSVKEKENMAKKMRTSRKYIDESYTKLFQHQAIQQQIKHDSSNDIQAIDETNPYDKQKARAKTYYYRNRDEIIRKQKEYQRKQGSFKNSRERLLRFLNSSPDYANIMRDATKAKYNFKFINNRWV